MTGNKSNRGNTIKANSFISQCVLSTARIVPIRSPIKTGIVLLTYKRDDFNARCMHIHLIVIDVKLLCVQFRYTYYICHYKLYSELSADISTGYR